MSETTETPINICPHCGADLFEVGVVEAISGGYSETEIHFVGGKTEIGTTDVQDFDEQSGLCTMCRKDIKHTAVEIIEAFEAAHQGDVQ